MNVRECSPEDCGGGGCVLRAGVDLDRRGLSEGHDSTGCSHGT